MNRPRLTVRTRLTLLYTTLSAVCGAIVIAVSYALVARLGVSGQGDGPTAAEQATFLMRCRSDLQHIPALAAKCNGALQQVGAQHQRDRTLSHLLHYSAITLAVVVAVAAVFGWIIAGRSLRPVHRITAAARAASEQHLSDRVGLRGPHDELRELAETFDDMLERLQDAFESQQQFIANASHELRTPLAVMRTTVDVVLDNPVSTPEELRSMGADVRAAVDHAEHLIGSLLILARRERALTIHDQVDLATAAENVLDIANLGGRQVHAVLEPAVVAGDPVLAERLIANLIDNAVRYNVATGDIWISTRTTPGGSQLRVANTGSPISASDSARIFTPFLRLDNRTSHDGSGLGLAIVESIVAIHRGTVTAHPRNGGGLTITVTIPAATGPGGN